jgi:hypothetical protein
MDRLQEAIGIGLILGVIHGAVQPAFAVPVVPNFTQGTLTSTTTTKSVVTETISSRDYRTGWEYTITGTNITNGGAAVNPTQRVTSSATAGTQSSLDLNAIGTYSIQDATKSWQFTQTYSGPGLVNETVIQRNTQVESVTESVSVFSQ